MSKPDHVHNGDFFLLLGLMLLVTVTMFYMTMILTNRIDDLEATLTPTPVATQEVR